MIARVLMDAMVIMSYEVNQGGPMSSGLFFLCLLFDRAGPVGDIFEFASYLDMSSILKDIENKLSMTRHRPWSSREKNS